MSARTYRVSSDSGCDLRDLGCVIYRPLVGYLSSFCLVHGPCFFEGGFSFAQLDQWATQKGSTDLFRQCVGFRSADSALRRL